MAESINESQESLQALARRYFRMLAEQFPVMCASDEFYFLPRAEEAGEHYDQIDRLGTDEVSQLLEELGRFRRELEQKTYGLAQPKRYRKGTSSNTPLLERSIDLELLKSSIAALRIEFEVNRSWIRNPLLYLKIAFIGLDHALNKPARDRKERLRRACDRLHAIPRLFEEAKRNLRNISGPYHHAALMMIEDCALFLQNTGMQYSDCRELIAALAGTAESLDAFHDFLKTSPQHREKPVAGAPMLEATLREHFRYRGTVSEVYRIGLSEWEKNLASLKDIERSMKGGRQWKELYDSYRPRGFRDTDTLSLYRQENNRLRTFFKTRGFPEFDAGAPVRIVETPTYLRSVRGTASFAAAFSRDPREKSLFYITASRVSGASNGTVRDRLHREYRFLTAHETYPGHHLLDLARRGLDSPIRRQIESPLFYEGWASYAESLLAEYGYLQDPLEHLVLHKRNLWRASRCLVDVGLNTGMIDLEEAERLLEKSGFSLEEARNQIRRFLLMPGYQLCYTLGTHEILKLRKRYGTLLSINRFHRIMLEGGELPFHLIDKRFKNQFGTRTRFSDKRPSHGRENTKGGVPGE